MSLHTRVVTVGLFFLSAGCGSSPSAPTPSIAQVGGVWRGTTTLTNFTGGECLAPLLTQVVGSRAEITLSIQQSGNNLTATSTDVQSGGSCNYTGSVGANSLSLNTQSCTVGSLLGVTCPTGARRDMLLQTSSFTGTVSGASITGTESETFNIVVAGTGVGVGLMTANSNVALTKQ